MYKMGMDLDKCVYHGSSTIQLWMKLVFHKVKEWNTVFKTLLGICFRGPLKTGQTSLKKMNVTGSFSRLFERC